MALYRTLKAALAAPIPADRQFEASQSDKLFIRAHFPQEADAAIRSRRRDYDRKRRAARRAQAAEEAAGRSGRPAGAAASLEQGDASGAPREAD